MQESYLNKYFSAVAVKRLSEVESNKCVSNQHEYNGIKQLKQMFKTNIRRIPTQFLYIDDGNIIEACGELSWYDARENHPTRTEWRLYYPSNDVTIRSTAGDSLFICLKKDNSALEIITKKDSIIENQLYWLFGIDPFDNSREFTAKTDLQNLKSNKIFFLTKRILNIIGIEIQPEHEDYTETLITKFGSNFPSTKEFTDFARSHVDINPKKCPDEALLKWYDITESMFMCMERHIIKERLEKGFVYDGKVNVEEFIKFSLSVNNRRKSRAGLSFENHLEALFNCNNIHYSHTPVTENNSKPDFIFPSIELYKDDSFPEKLLTMLGAKTTAKDRWRQVLEEADRIKSNKYLITLEGAISENQTNEMKSRNLKLVVPKPIHNSFTDLQKKWLLSVADFIALVKERQKDSEQLKKVKLF